MKLRSYLLVELGLVLTLGLVSSSLAITLKEDGSSSISLNSENSIYIENDNDFANYAIRGDGSVNNPWVISGFKIGNTSAGIQIFNTRDYFILENNIISNCSSYGIMLINITNGIIRNNTIFNCEKAIFGNFLDSINIVFNNISNCNYGIDAGDMSGIIVENNFLYDISTTGISVGNIGVTVKNNTLINTGGDGIVLWNVNNNNGEVSFNVIKNSGRYGIKVSDSSIRIYNNSIENSSSYGLYLYNANGSQVYYNQFIDNNVNGSQAYSNADASFYNNYWNDLSGKDNDCDGIIDNAAYLIDGINLTDSAPLSDPSMCPVHYLKAPTFLFPIGGEEVSGVLQVSWTAGNDSFDHSLYYSLYYSLNYEDWTLIIANISLLYYNWDTTSVINGNYTLKITVTCSEGLSNYSISDEFMISNPPFIHPPRFINPKPHEIISGVYNLTWIPGFESTGLKGIINIFYSIDNGNSWHTIVWGLDSSSTFYLWDTTNFPNSNNYDLELQLRINDTYHSASHIYPITVNNTKSSGDENTTGSSTSFTQSTSTSSSSESTPTANETLKTPEIPLEMHFYDAWIPLSFIGLLNIRRIRKNGK